MEYTTDKEKMHPLPPQDFGVSRIWGDFPRGAVVPFGLPPDDRSDVRVGCLFSGQFLRHPSSSYAQLLVTTREPACGPRNIVALCPPEIYWHTLSHAPCHLAFGRGPPPVPSLLASMSGYHSPCSLGNSSPGTLGVDNICIFHFCCRVEFLLRVTAVRPFG